MDLAARFIEIKERRTIEATRKNLIGSTGKLGVIARYLGTPILYQTQGDSNYLSDPFEFQEGLPILDEENSIGIEGWLFDGLRRGMHLEIRYQDSEKKLTCHWKGYVVYTEVAGELLSYNPFSEWEQMVETLYGTAKKQQKDRKKESEVADSASAKAMAQGFWQSLRLRWGI